MFTLIKPGKGFSEGSNSVWVADTQWKVSSYGTSESSGISKRPRPLNLLVMVYRNFEYVPFFVVANFDLTHA